MIILEISKVKQPTNVIWKIINETLQIPEKFTKTKLFVGRQFMNVTRGVKGEVWRMMDTKTVRKNHPKKS